MYLQSLKGLGEVLGIDVTGYPYDKRVCNCNGVDDIDPRIILLQRRNAEGYAREERYHYVRSYHYYGQNAGLEVPPSEVLTPEESLVGCFDQPVVDDVGCHDEYRSQHVLGKVDSSTEIQLGKLKRRCEYDS